MSVQLGNITLDPPVFLAPLAGITDLPFRNLVSSFGAGLVVSEMIASNEMVVNNPSAQARAELGFGVERTSVQIAGRDARLMAECAKICAGNGARIIDINMGCPAKKVTGGQSGSALMKVPDLALSLIEAVVGAVDVPVTLKMRLGWDDDCLNSPDMAKRAESAGVQMVTVHGRTRCQFYKGSADWAAISNVVKAVDIPVIANGDIVDAASARLALEASGAAGVMVGRGAQGRPWALAQIGAELFGGVAPVTPKGDALLDVILRHHDAMIDFYGEQHGIKVARKHLGWYMDDLTVTPEQRKQILTEKNPSTVKALVSDLDFSVQLAA